MQELISLLKQNSFLEKVILSLIFLLVTLILIKLTNKVLFKTIKDNSLYYVTKKRFNYLYAIVLMVVIALQWSSSKVDLTLYIGFISAGIAISLREIFTNIAAWMIIVVQKPFEVGDRISVNGRWGDVIDLKLFHFVVMDVSDRNMGEQSTGRVSHIPNNYIFLHQLTNANKGFGHVWHEIDLKLTKDSNWQKAKDMLYEIVEKHGLNVIEEAQEEVRKASKKYMLYYNNLTPIVYMTYKDSVIVLTLRYLSKPRQCRVIEDALWSDILSELSNHNDVYLK